MEDEHAIIRTRILYRQLEQTQNKLLDTIEQIGRFTNIIREHIYPEEINQTITNKAKEFNESIKWTTQCMQTTNEELENTAKIALQLNQVYFESIQHRVGHRIQNGNRQ